MIFIMFRFCESWVDLSETDVSSVKTNEDLKRDWNAALVGRSWMPGDPAEERRKYIDEGINDYTFEAPGLHV